ncbi:hypothetical protein [Kitasatospora paracochleata]|uniref:Uncharacterized protein n=1 Tax=Kitasatospora paracochleata TaxID=58354 RepID=A0ABT1J0C1_9ACTN|nr:hypothetical protein [Kitasatospora paracochleata]MCP2310241.1 hypothetical protein [Kitasatospora paracochleata]
MRAQHAKQAQAQVQAWPESESGPEPSGAAGWVGRARRPAWLPGPRALAAGGAILAAQVCALGLGIADAHAATTPAGPAGPAGLIGPAEAGRPGAVRSGGGAAGGSAGAPGSAAPSGRAEDPGLLGQLADTAAPVLEQPAASVEQVLQDRIRTDGLPLPGQVAGVPDAFAIASGLVPGVPPQSRGADDPRASRSTAGPDAVLPTGPGAVVPVQRTAVAAAVPAVDGHPAGVRPAPARPDGSPAEPDAAATDDLALAAATPAARPDGGDTGTAVLAPIAAGLLLTGAAMYKHRGLPAGH